MTKTHAHRAGLLLSFALVAACGSEVKMAEAPTTDVAAAGAGDGNASPGASGLAVAKDPPASCSTGTPCKSGEICCRVQADGPVVEYCAAPIAGQDNPLPACSAALPAALKKATVSVSYTALVCVDSGDCRPDELCVLAAPYSSDSSVATCVSKKAADGFSELCGHGTCKLGKSACGPINPDADWSAPRSCAPTSPIQCGKASCERPQVCCAREKGPECVAESECASLSEGARWSCTSSKECAEGQVCCVTGAGQMGAACAFSCDTQSQLPACSKDADCPVVFGAKSKCKAAENAPSKQVKSCQM